MRGSSGAVMEIKPTFVRKWGPAATIGPRILEQGRWLQANECEGLVRVRQLLETGSQLGYEMEHLTVPPLHLLDTDLVVNEVTGLLMRCVWSKQPQVEFDSEEHRLRIAPLLSYIGSSADAMDEMRMLIDPVLKDVPRALTHGDPIMDNVLMRGDNLVLVDPIPATPALPDLRCVDLGRLLQSVVGYERVRYGLRGPRMGSTSLVRSGVDTLDEWVASLYFACVHLMRSMHYVNSDVRAAIYTECFMPMFDMLQEEI